MQTVTFGFPVAQLKLAKELINAPSNFTLCFNVLCILQTFRCFPCVSKEPFHLSTFKLLLKSFD